MKCKLSIASIILSCGILSLVACAGSNAKSSNDVPLTEVHFFSNNDLIVYPREDYILPAGQLREIVVSIPDSIHGKLVINEPYVSRNKLVVTLERIEDEFGNSSTNTSDNPNDTPDNHDDPDLIVLDAIVNESEKRYNFPLDEELPAGKWRINIPDGFFEVQPDVVEVKEMPFTSDSLSSLTIPGAWHKDGAKWERQPMFSIHDDDGVDFKIKASRAPYPIPNRYGYFSMLYPLLESLGLRGCLSVEGWRVGMTDNPPVPNDNGKIMLRLQDEKGWEIMAHSMEVFGGGVYNNWYVESLDSELANKILESAVNKGWSSNTETVYDAETGKQYFPNEDNTEWVESSQNFIKQYAYKYGTKIPVLYDNNHNVEYHWGEWFKLAEEFGFKSKAWVQHNAITSHDYAKEILKYGPYGFSDIEPPYQYNVPMLRSTLTRMMMEGQSAPGYIGETSDNNLADPVQLIWFKRYIDQCVADGGWMIMGLHAYRKCWVNYLPGALVSEGGDYPDEWVEPLDGMDFLNDPLTPPSRLGISDWSEWYPCPGTRLDMLREILLYCKEKGMLNVTSTEGFEIMGNKQMSGYYNGDVRIGHDRYFMEGDRDKYPHYVESATGEESYYNPLISEGITKSFLIESRNMNTSVEPVASSISSDNVIYYNIPGNRVDESCLGRGIYIRIDSNGAKKIIR